MHQTELAKYLQRAELEDMFYGKTTGNRIWSNGTVKFAAEYGLFLGQLAGVATPDLRNQLFNKRFTEHVHTSIGKFTQRGLPRLREIVSLPSARQVILSEVRQHYDFVIATNNRPALGWVLPDGDNSYDFLLDKLPPQASRLMMQSQVVLGEGMSADLDSF